MAALVSVVVDSAVEAFVAIEAVMEQEVESDTKVEVGSLAVAEEVGVTVVELPLLMPLLDLVVVVVADLLVVAVAAASGDLRTAPMAQDLTA